MIEKFYESMDLHESCKIDSTIFKKYFYENTSIKAIDKDIFKDDIAKITLKYSLKEENINIPEYKDNDVEYPEIEIIEVNLLNDKRYNKICEFIQKVIPYPLIIILTMYNKLIINVAYKRINKNDAEKNTVEKLIYSNWIDFDNLSDNEVLFLKSINIRNLVFSNMYKLYCSFAEKINILNASKIAGNFKNLENRDIEEVNEFNNEINFIDDELKRLEIEIKKEVQFNKRMDINIKIKKLEEKRNRLVEKLKE